MQRRDMKIWMVGLVVIMFFGASYIPSLAGSNVHWKEETREHQVREEHRDGELTRGTQLVSFSPTDDSYVDWYAPDTLYGNSPSLVVRPVDFWEISALVKFDISSIPSDAQIQSATLNLYHWHWWDANPAGRVLDLHRVTEDWDEETVTYNTRPAWDSSIIASAVVPAVPPSPDLSGAWMTWDVTNEVQEIINGFISNHGWQIMGHFMDNPMIYFRSKENITDIPYLEIEYDFEEEEVGANWLGNQQISDSNSLIYGAYNPDIKADSSDDLHIIWQDFRDFSWELYYEKIDEHGSELVSEKRITQCSSQSEPHPTLDIDADGYVHIVWQDDRDGNAEIYYTKLDNEGNTEIADTRITSTTGASYYPTIRISDTGNVHIAWEEIVLPHSYVYYKKLDNNGNPLTGDVQITMGEALPEHPSIALKNDTLAFITWEDNCNDDDYEIYIDDVEIDLVPTAISYTADAPPNPSRPYLAVVDEPLTIQAEIENKGEISVQHARVDLLIDETLLQSFDIAVDAGSTTIVTYPWTPTSFDQGHHLLSVVVDPEQELDEYHRDNNNLETSMPILYQGDVHDDPWEIMGAEYPPHGSIIACENLQLFPDGSLTLEYSDLILFGGANMQLEGNFIARNSGITSSHDSECMMFQVFPTSNNIEITDCDISHLGSLGIEMDAPTAMVTITRNTISDSETAFTLNNGAYSFSDNTILNSDNFDFDLGPGTSLTLTDCFFDRNKVHFGPGSELMYNKHAAVTIFDENDNLADNAYVVITDAYETPFFIGYTDENGQIPQQLFSVFHETEGGGTNEYAPYTVYASSTPGGESSCQFLINPGGLFGPGGGMFGGNLNFKTVTKYAILWAGLDNTDQGKDRWAYWNDIEYMYHALIDIKGYNKANVYVLFMNGKDDDGQTNSIINCSATEPNLETVFSTIGNVIQNDDDHADTLLIFTTDHGGKDPIKLCVTSGSVVTDFELANLIDTYIGDKATKIMIAMGQCYSGGFIDDLHGQNRVILTAAKKDEYSWWYHFPNDPDSNPADGHSYFMVEFISAFHNHQPGVGKYPDSDLSNAKTDYYLQSPSSNPYHSNPLASLDDSGNGAISWHEAFDYAHDNDLKGFVNGKEGAQEHSQEIDDDVVVVASLYGKIYIYWYDGDGTLSGTYFNPGGTHRKVFVEDMDKDGDDDIVTVDSSGDQIKICLNNGDWTFSTSNYAVGDYPWGLSLADFDNDGDLDAVACNNNDDDVSVLYNDGSGALALGTRSDYTVGDYPVEVIAGNLDANSYPDIVTANWNDYNISVLISQSSGTSFGGRTDYALSGQPSGVELCDIDNDGDNDIIVTVVKGSGSGEVKIFKNNGYGSFTSFATLPTGSYPNAPHVADLDSDNDPDLIVVNYLDYNFSIYKNTGSGNFVYEKSYYIVDSANSVDVFTTDVDGDEDLDIIVPTSDPDAVWVFINRDTNNQGYLNFDAGEKTNVPCSGGYARPYAIHGTNHNTPRKWYI